MGDPLLSICVCHFLTMSRGPGTFINTTVYSDLAPGPLNTNVYFPATSSASFALYKVSKDIRL